MSCKDENRTRVVGLNAGIGRLLAGALAVLLLTGCESLLDVAEDPNTVPDEELTNPASLQARLVGAEADFFFAYDMAIVFGGLFTDELIDGTGVDEVDERRVTSDDGLIGAADENPEGIDGLWTPMQRAAFTSDLLQDDIQADNFPDQIDDPASSAELARMSLFAGYSKLALGQLFCSTAFGGDGPEHSSQETYDLAAEEFTLAIDAANAAADVRNAALVGRARARLLAGDESGALSDANQVPVGFEFVANVYSTNSSKEENDLWNMLTDSQRFSVAAEFRDLTIDDTGEADPRVDVFQDPNDQFAIDGITPLFQASKYEFPTAPIRLASGHEAQYMIAQIQGGQQAVDIINEVRLRQGISDEFQSTDEQEILDKLIDERARTLFLEGQRMGDLRHYLEAHGIDRFPTGEGFGDQTCMPLPDVERDNNPDI